MSIRSGEVFQGGKLARAWNVLRRDDHLFTNEGLRSILDRAHTATTFAETEVPLRVVATDLSTGEEVVFASGPVEAALLASTALPALFPPIEHDGRLLVDGTVTNTVPLWHALSGPVDRIYVCNVSGALIERRMRSPLDVAVRAFAISRNQRFDLKLRHAPPEVDVVVLPNPSDQRELFDFSDSMMLIEEAHHLAARALDEHEAERARPASVPAAAGSAAAPRWRDALLRDAQRPSGAHRDQRSMKVASLARSRKAPGRMPITRVSAAVTARTTAAGGSTRSGRRRGLGFLRRLFAARVHRHHDPQVEEPGDDRHEHADDGQVVQAGVDRGCEHLELGHESSGHRHPGLGEQEEQYVAL